MEIELAKEAPDDVVATVVGATSDGHQPVAGIDRTLLSSLGFEGRRDQAVTVPQPEAAGVTVVVGVGAAADVDAHSLRRAAAVAAREAGRHDVVANRLADLVEPPQRPAAAGAIAEGALLGSYRFGRYKSSDPAVRTSRTVVVSGGGQRAATAVEAGVAVAEGVCLARDLVNEPGGSLTPEAFADVARDVAERAGLELEVMDRDAIVDAGMGGLLGVNRGSEQPPRFVQLTYEPSSPRGTLALVGKGITFDAGGLSIKSSDGMMAMKNDMAGAAAVLGAFSALGVVAPRCRVRGYIPLTDNMLGGDATRPGDVLTIRGGTTVEVLNTDAEGRLVLADALNLASEHEPDAIVDLATLTGAVEVALGTRVAGLMGNRQSWIDQVSDAATRAGERMWPLPLPADYRAWLDSDVADLRNISKVPRAGTITAGLFLAEFVADGIPWAHLDIAGTSWSKETWGVDGVGGTGYGVRTLVELAKGFKRPARD
ncbi:MAG: leucyl aminopeptidase [Acidimicrobiia bacterium]|nr:leucyl aminopeptidase [Acidimicrobiia bacterium]